MRILLKIKLGCIKVCFTDGLHLLVKDRLILDFGIQPALAAMRLQVGFFQIATDLADRDRRHDATLGHFLGQLAMRPVVDGAL